MPAKSQAQQKMFGIAHAIQQGKMPASKARGPATDVAKAAKPKDVKDFASTSTKGLPKKVKKEQIERIREYVTKVVREVLAEAKSEAYSVSQGKDGDWWVHGPGGYQDGPFATRGKAHGYMVDYKRTGKPAPEGTRTIEEAQTIKPQRYTMKQDEESGDWYVWDGKTLHKSFDADDRRTASRTLWTLRRKEGGSVQEAKSDDPFFKNQLKIARSTLKMSKAGAQVMGGMTHDEARAFLKKHGLKEAYNRGTAVIVIGRNGVIHWRASDGSYDADLPGKRSKEHVKRRIAQLKKKLWGYTIKIIDDEGMLKEARAKWELEWYDEKVGGGKWFYKTVATKRQADTEMDDIADRLKAATPEKSPIVSYTRKMNEANWQHGVRRGGARGETPEIRGDRERRDARAMAQQSKVSKSERARVAKERLKILAQTIKTRKSARIGGVIVRAKDAESILRAMKNEMTPNLRDTFLSMTTFDKVIRTAIMLNK